MISSESEFQTSLARFFSKGHMVQPSSIQVRSAELTLPQLPAQFSSIQLKLAYESSDMLNLDKLTQLFLKTT